ncbi:cysteinyl leukotriene receptor 2-like [Polyodon spathula]|uniref:cysteinyl leukotriene receptor 2-like n=1 Tax=Polyodon spathula TaxID=7913 RepID=UPI001B7DD76C|nr:cysteinyl leukotriene receptor 2-like [Polyodon spathula]
MAGNTPLGNEVQNSVLNVTYECIPPYHSAQFILRPVVYSIICFLGLTGNSFSLWTLLTNKNTTIFRNPFMISLAVMDLQFAFCLLFKVIYDAKGSNWIFGEVFCKIFHSLYIANIFGCPLILTCISIERYVALAPPTRTLQLHRQAFRITLCCFIWVVVLTACVSLTCSGKLTNQLDKDRTACGESFSQVEWINRIGIMSIVGSCIGFCVPFLILVICYTVIARKLSNLLGENPATLNIKKKSMRTILIVITVLTVCFLPFHTINIIKSTLKLLKLNSSYNSFCTAYAIMEAVTSFNSCLNPIVYYYQAEGFNWMSRCCHSQGELDEAANMEQRDSHKHATRIDNIPVTNAP